MKNLLAFIFGNKAKVGTNNTQTPTQSPVYGNPADFTPHKGVSGWDYSDYCSHCLCNVTTHDTLVGICPQCGSSPESILYWKTRCYRKIATPNGVQFQYRYGKGTHSFWELSPYQPHIPRNEEMKKSFYEAKEAKSK